LTLKIFQTTAILSSLSKSKEAVQNLPQAAFREVDTYDILTAPPMPNSYIRYVILHGLNVLYDNKRCNLLEIAILSI